MMSLSGWQLPLLFTKTTTHDQMGWKMGMDRPWEMGSMLCEMTQVSVALNKPLNMGVHSILSQMLIVIITIK